MKKRIVSPYIRKRFDKAEKATFIYNYFDNSSQKIDDNLLTILKECVQPRSDEELGQKFGKDFVEILLEKRYLLDAKQIWLQHALDTLDIEVNTYCNWKCEYCPRTFYSAKPKIMPEDRFEFILKRAKAYGHIKNISLSFYNEPTIDPLFLKRVKLIKKYGFQLLLFTNATGLDDSCIAYFKSISETISTIVVSLPSIERSTFCKMTGSTSYDHTLKTIQNIIHADLPLSLSVQGLSPQKEENLKRIKQRFPNVSTGQWPTSDRCGALKNQYFNNIQIAGPLKGCHQIFRTMLVNVEGKCFLCCNDFFQKNILGDLLTQSLKELLESEKAQHLRQKIFGHIQPEEGFLCRNCDFMQNNIIINRLFDPFKSESV